MLARLGIVALLLTTPLAGRAWAGGGTTWLPAFSSEDFPREVRQQVQQAYEAARDHPSDSEAVGRLAMLLDLYHRPEDAARCYEHARQLSPHVFKWPYYEGNLRVHQKEQAQAASLFHGALQIDASYLPAQLKLAASLLESGKLEESGSMYAAIVKDYPDAAEAHCGLGRILNLRGNAQGAIPELQRAIELFPPYGAAHYALAQAERKAGNPAEAAAQLKLYEAHRTLVPPIEDPLRDAMREIDMSAAAHLEWGLELREVGRTREAITETERSAALDPQLVQAQVNLIILYGQLGNFNKAEEHYQKAVALSPRQFPDAYYNYGVVLMNAKRLAEAKEAFGQAIDINPSYADAHNNLGYVLELEGRLEDAAAEYRKAVEEKPEFRQAHFNLARMLIQQQDLQGGISQLLQTLTPVDTNTPTYLYALGAAYGRAGDKDRALDYLGQAREQAKILGQAQLLTQVEGDIRRLSGVPQP